MIYYVNIDNSMLDNTKFCDVYARKIGILFSPAETFCIFPPSHLKSLPGLPLHFQNTVVLFVHSCTLYGIFVTNHNLYKMCMVDLMRLCLISNLFHVM